MVFPRHFPALAQAHIETGVTIASQNVARANPARKRQSEIRLCGSRVSKDVDATRLLEHSRLRLGRHLCYSSEEPVGRPALATIYAERKTAGPACQTGKL